MSMETNEGYCEDCGKYRILTQDHDADPETWLCHSCVEDWFSHMGRDISDVA
jgi:hypothetical protein